MRTSYARISTRTSSQALYSHIHEHTHTHTENILYLTPRLPEMAKSQTSNVYHITAPPTLVIIFTNQFHGFLAEWRTIYDMQCDATHRVALPISRFIRKYLLIKPKNHKFPTYILKRLTASPLLTMGKHNYAEVAMLWRRDVCTTTRENE